MTDQEDKSKDISRPFYQSAQFIIDSVRSLGLNIHPDSRLMRMYRVLCKPDGTSRGTIEPTDPDFQTALEALRDITQLEFVFDQINHHPEPDKYKSLVRRLPIAENHGGGYFL